jgi:hypothetical protein
MKKTFLGIGASVGNAGCVMEFQCDSERAYAGLLVFKPSN